MNLAPSFYTLYRRSRYSKTLEGDVAEGTQQNRRELYAVAALAFAIKHDSEFRTHFLKTVCGAPNGGNESPIISVQPNHHSDLEIKFPASSQIVVVEFKLGADLEDKQNPAREAIFFGPDGYGTQIMGSAFKTRVYVVLDEFQHFDTRERNGLLCRAHTWADLIPDREVSTIWSDLLNSLGELGIAAYRFEKFRGMKNSEHTKQAVAMHQILSAVASRLKVRDTDGMDINEEGEHAWYGRNIPKGSLLKFVDLEIRVQPNSDSLGWFGYQSGPSEFGPAIWLYCGSDQAAEAAALFVKERLMAGPPGRLFISETNVCFTAAAQSHSGDAEWFDAVFQRLEDRSQPKSKES